MTRKPRVFSISPGTPFLPHFVDALLSGILIDNFASNGNIQATLADTLIYVPTRRAARALRTAFFEKSHMQSSFLPTICPLGDINEESCLFIESNTNTLINTPPIGESERLLLLARLIRLWRENLPTHLQSMFGTEDVFIPATTADAIWLAQDLACLMDEMETESVDWSRLKEIVPDMVAEWWQITLDFLTIVTQSWPQILKERQKSNPVEWRNQAFKMHADILHRTQPHKPIIAAGVTSSIPTIANFLKVIACLPKGAVILPGLDLQMDETQWDALGAFNKEKTIFDPSHHTAAFSHPQYHLKKLLSLMKCQRIHVREIGQKSAIKIRRAALLSEALRPASTTDLWAQIVRDDYEDICADWSLIEAPNEREEALAISIALRNAIEDPKKTAALITNDRNLARRVSAELQRFGIEANDSGEIPLAQTLPSTLLRLLLENIFKPGDPIAFLSLLKHPLTTLEYNRNYLREMAENFELLVLRGNASRINLCECDQFFKTWMKTHSHKISNNCTLYLQKIEEADFLCHLLVKAVEPLVSLIKQDRECTINEAAIATVEVFENFGRDVDNSLEHLYQNEAGKALVTFLRELVSDQSGLKFRLHEWPALFSALMATRSVSPSPGGHPRLFIWGTLESRLQTVNTVVIGSLNEGSWPIKTHNDAFLSRPMKMTLTLEPPEQRIGLSAHDFQWAMGMDKVIMSRATRVNHTPSVPSRWLQRLETVVGKQVWKQICTRGEILLHWAKMLDNTNSITASERPCPVPPLDIRPRHFSVTEIEILRHDPYAIYAKKILRLKPLKALIHDPCSAELGTLYHTILAVFCTQIKNQNATDMLDILLTIGRKEFDKLNLPPDIEAIWWLNFENFAPFLIQWEQSLGSRKRHAEVIAQNTLIGETGVTLSGRADRIDILSDKTVEIIDFKTSIPPSSTQVINLFSPQLALETALLIQGAFIDFKDLTPSNLLYIPLKRKGEIKPIAIINKKDQQNAISLGKKAWKHLISLINYYQNPQQGYLSHAVPFKKSYESDYDHLARLLEWSIGFDKADQS
ncbi:MULTISPECIES: double-strand break repair protein AddB [unclassified Bartonella]|uniref:double-strand break repair protein AddB n=1 Tax=unclassified Bartonella TaxID=2645622 RepID=UPI000999B61C|nr:MULTISPECIES: double-strand break repair protein AddB [unclassified Bartonella]AQX28622.1 DNA helicase/exodeoxyribonuclease V, subunit B [Bartonella sp. JB15]AQX29878.1 DNA helicase/exodeoxyribonuclease V, subunit B [Bartonella sp. JB63]